jgi:hypothetical protein
MGAGMPTVGKPGISTGIRGNPITSSRARIRDRVIRTFSMDRLLRDPITRPVAAIKTAARTHHSNSQIPHPPSTRTTISMHATPPPTKPTTTIGGTMEAGRPDKPRTKSSQQPTTSSK